MDFPFVTIHKWVLPPFMETPIVPMNLANYPLVNVYIAMDNHHFIAGKITTISKSPFSIAMLVHQRVFDLIWWPHSPICHLT